ncbi:hypothetical protein [Dryocola sp. LX212]
MPPDYRSTVMPEAFSLADAEWIQEQLLRLSPSVRQKAITRYADVYLLTMEEELVSYRKENKARHEANTRLRLFADTHARALQGYTEKPPSIGQ